MQQRAGFAASMDNPPSRTAGACRRQRELRTRRTTFRLAVATSSRKCFRAAPHLRERACGRATAKLPTEQALRVDDASFRCALSRRLGLPVTPDSVACEGCGNTVDAHGVHRSTQHVHAVRACSVETQAAGPDMAPDLQRSGRSHPRS